MQFNKHTTYAYIFPSTEITFYLREYISLYPPFPLFYFLLSPFISWILFFDAFLAKGHLEFFLCDAAELDDPDGVVTQECLNMNPLTRAEGDNENSPIDPDYSGRYYGTLLRSLL